GSVRRASPVACPDVLRWWRPALRGDRRERRRCLDHGGGELTQGHAPSLRVEEEALTTPPHESRTQGARTTPPTPAAAPRARPPGPTRLQAPSSPRDARPRRRAQE